MLTLLEALDTLDGLDTPGDPRRGPARQQVVNALRALPPGALRQEDAPPLLERVASHLETFPALPARALTPPAPAVGATWWLSGHDAAGAVLRVRLDALRPGQRPFEAFWPAGRADTAAERAASRAYDAACAYLGTRPLAPLRGWHRLVLEDLPDGWPAPEVEGGSMGAPLALMLLSTWTRQPLPVTRAVTGNLDARGRLVLPPSGTAALEAKLRAVARERRCIETVFVPPGYEKVECPPGLEVRAVEDLRGLAHAFGLSPGAPPHPITVPAYLEAVEELVALEEMRAAPDGLLRERAESVAGAWAELASATPDPPWALRMAHAELATVLIAVRARCGDVAAATAAVEEADGWIEGETLPPLLESRLRNVQASALLPLRRFAQARRYAATARAAAERASHRLQAARVASNQGAIEAHAGRFEASLTYLEEALAAFEEAAPWEANIARCHRVGVLGRLGRFEEAHAALEEAVDRTLGDAHLPAGWRASNLLYLDYEALKLSLLEGETRAMRRAMRRVSARLREASGAWPAAGIAARAVEACCRTGDVALADRWLAFLERLAREPGAPDLSRWLGRAHAALCLRRLEMGPPPDPPLCTLTKAWLQQLGEAPRLEAEHLAKRLEAEFY